MTGEKDEGADPDQGSADGVYLEARASGHARVYQAARDMHIRYESEGLIAHRVEGADVVEECPYPGLAAFGPEEARWFFGRDALLAELTGMLSEQLPDQGPVMLVASSGAGKSSLLHAGLMPALDRGVLPQMGSRRWPRLLFTPTDRPLTALAVRLSPFLGTPPERVSAVLANNPETAADLMRAAVSAGQVPGGGLAIVVDQFEEAFTLCGDDKERAAFVEALCTLGSANPATGLVALSLRADFYLHACAYPMLRAALRDRQVLMGPMTEAELRQAIEHPSQVAGLELEPGLVQLLIRDLGGPRGNGSLSGGVPGYDAGRLPLLAHALRATWQQRHGHVLTVDGYMATGGILHAIATSAERTFSRLDSSEQDLARLLFLRMVRIGDRTEDTRRRVTHAELVQDSRSPASAEAVISAFTRARLLTHERETVEITHEALLREWPRLRGWIDTDHAGRLVHQDIEEQAAEWVAARQDASMLYRGTRLEAATTWVKSSASRDELTARARAFLAASARQKRRTLWLRRSAVAALIILAVTATLLAVAANAQSHTAIRERNQAIFNQVTAEAASLVSTNPSLAAEFNLAAYRMDPTSSLYTSLLNTEATGLAAPLEIPAKPFAGITFGPEGRILAGVGGRTIALWNTADAKQPVSVGSLPGVTASADSVSISPDDQTIAAGLSNGTVRMWNIADPARPKTIGKALHVALAAASVKVAFDPHGHLLLVDVAGNRYSLFELWNVSNPAHPVYLNFLAPCTPTSGALSDDGEHVAMGCSDGWVYLANITDPARPHVLGKVQASTGANITSLAFSPDGNTLASAAYNDQTFSLWNVTDPQHPSAFGSPVNWLNDGVTAISFSPDAPVLATADHDGTVQLWSIANPANFGDLGPAMTAGVGPATDVAFSPDGQTVAAGYVDGSIRLWSIPHFLATGYGDGFQDGLTFSADGRLLASSNITSGALNLWEITGRSPPLKAGSPIVCATGSVTGTEVVAFAPRKPVLAAGCDSGVIRLWNMTDPFHVTPMSPWMVAGPKNDSVNSVAFDASGKTMAASDYGGLVTLWDVTDPAHPVEMSHLTTGYKGWQVTSISPDGHTLAVGYGTTVQLWSIADLAHPHLIPALLTGPTQWVTCIAFDHGGGILAAGNADDNIYLWNTRGPHPGAHLRTLTGHTDIVNSVAFSPDDRTLASSSDDDTVRLWDTATAAPIGNPLTGHTDYALAVAFSPARGTLASIGLDEAVYLWNLNVSDAISRICATTAGVLTPSLWHKDLPGVPYVPPCKTQ
jgi:WD40 repeat protein